MRRWSFAVIALWLTPQAQAAEVQVRVNGALVDIQATAAPLQDVLARLAQQTGMKVVYEGAPPSTLVTLTLAGRTPTEAVLALFEGLGVNYAMMADRTGLRVDTLLVTGISTGSSSTAASRPGAPATPPPPPEQRARPQRPPNPLANEAETDEDQEDETARPSPPPRGPGPAQGGPGQPVSPFTGTIGPLTMPTAPPPAASPAPSPTPSPGGFEGRQ